MSNPIAPLAGHKSHKTFYILNENENHFIFLKNSHKCYEGMNKSLSSIFYQISEYKLLKIVYFYIKLCLNYSVQAIYAWRGTYVHPHLEKTRILFASESVLFLTLKDVKEPTVSQNPLSPPIPTQPQPACTLYQYKQPQYTNQYTNQQLIPIVVQPTLNFQFIPQLQPKQYQAKTFNHRKHNAMSNYDIRCI